MDPCKKDLETPQATATESYLYAASVDGMAQWVYFVHDRKSLCYVPVA